MPDIRHHRPFGRVLHHRPGRAAAITDTTLG